MSDWREVLQVQFLGNPLGTWAVAVGIFLVTFTILPLLKRFITARRRARGEHGGPPVLELLALLVQRTARLFLWGVALWLGAQDLSFPPKVERALTVGLVLLFWMQMARWTMTAVRFAVDARRQRSTGPDTLLKSSMAVILFIAGLVIWGVAALLALDSLGIAVKPLLAGLGIGGIALALAVQSVLSDLLASVSIALDKPFALGDALGVDDISGTVEYIGVKSTRLRSVNGEQIIIPNSNLVASRVRNNTRATERRVVFTISVGQETPLAQLQKIPGLIRSLIEAHPDVRFDRSHFAKIAAASFDFEAVYIVKTTDYVRHMDILQEINLQLIESFEKEGVAFAYPVQRLYLEQQQPVQSQLVSDQK